MIDIDNVRDRVYAGALLLTLVRPDEEWWNKIDLVRLDLDNLFACILGQLYGGFGHGLDALDLSSEDAHHFGFYVATGNRYDLSFLREEYAALTEEWRSLIKALRSNEMFEEALAA